MTELDALVIKLVTKIGLRIVRDADIGDHPALPMDGNDASVMQQVINELLDRRLLRWTINSHQQIAMGVPRKPLEPEGHVAVVAPQDLKPEQAVRALMRRDSRHAVMISAHGLSPRR